jgi:pSer/pThr/pTyr-binding forkhead associated (FHA) protein
MRPNLFAVLPYLVVESSDGERFATLERFPWLVGSGAHADLRFHERSVSRSHALLIWRNDLAAVRVIDLNSTNGTRVNGRRVRESTVLPGTRIAFGSVVAVYRLRRGVVHDLAHDSTPGPK